MKLKHPSNSASQTVTSSDTQLLVRETLRISANLASAPPPSPGAAVVAGPEHPLHHDSSFGGIAEDQFVDSSLRLICCEEIDGRRWKYYADNDSVRSNGLKQLKKNSIRAVSLQTPQAPVDVSVFCSSYYLKFLLFSPPMELMAFIRSYVVPEGFSDSVTPSYVPYMTWRALKHFFGGAMGVFTTQTLLGSVGVSRSRSAPGDVAINWILKDGAGRVGKMLFARQGNKFDYDLKQLRFTGDLLMELGAGIELATAVVPHLFLPLACAANVVKNVGAVTSTSTRTPIYKAFAKGENIGDVTAKGECVGSIADLTHAKLFLGLVIDYDTLACEAWNWTEHNDFQKESIFGHHICIALMWIFDELLSRGEIDCIAYTKSCKIHYDSRIFLEDSLCFPFYSFVLLFGMRAKESWLSPASSNFARGELSGKHFQSPMETTQTYCSWPRFKDAFQDRNSYLAVNPIFEKERYIVTYDPSKGNIYALFKDEAKSDDILKATFHAHVLLHIIRTSNYDEPSSKKGEHNRSSALPTLGDLQSHVAESYKMVSALYVPFKNKAKEQNFFKLLDRESRFLLLGALRMSYYGTSPKSAPSIYISQNCLNMLLLELHPDAYGYYYSTAACIYGLWFFSVFQDWVMSESLLNPGRARLCEIVR
ncbi:hypothetical protein BUALT_Bualt19G0083900 [Buddleja alternifolia]|uniref:Protein root UVB sensitive 6 n=1 Tax=Buddleja alternifolia TaxID=168488 RepID=A0AAV6W0G3_9LAMI|nr:hypothetical protein BUALT_Bualt19G0083900 [Buddleja alternifolia]